MHIMMKQRDRAKKIKVLTLSDWMAALVIILKPELTTPDALSPAITACEYLLGNILDNYIAGL